MDDWEADDRDRANQPPKGRHEGEYGLHDNFVVDYADDCRGSRTATPDLQYKKPESSAGFVVMRSWVVRSGTCQALCVFNAFHLHFGLCQVAV